MVEVSTLVSILLKLKDEASEGVKDAGDSLEGMGQKATQAGASFIVVVESLKMVGQMVSDFIEPAVEMDAAVTRSAIAMGDAEVSAGKLRKEIGNLADENLKGMFSANQTAAAFQAIADEGLGLENTLGTVEAAMNIAAITGGELTGITTGLEDVMSAFNLGAEDAAHVSDVLVNTWKATGAEVDSKLIPSLSQIGSVAGAIGLSLEETTAILGVMKDKGVGNVTGLLTGFQQMASGMGEAGKLTEKFGVEVLDSTGKMKPMTKIFEELQSAGATAQDMFLAFGQRSAGAMVTVIDNLELVGEVADENLESTGEAMEDAGEFADSAAGETQSYAAEMENLETELAEGVLPALVDLMEISRPIIDILREYPGVIYAVVGAFVAYKLATIAQTIVTLIQTGAIWANTIALLANPLVWIAVLVFILILALWWLSENWDQVTEAMGDFNEQGAKFIDGVGKGLTDFFKKLPEVVEMAYDAIVFYYTELPLIAAEAALDMAKEFLKALGFNLPDDSIEEIFADPLGYLEDLIDEAAEWGEKVIKEFLNGMKKQVEESEDFIQENVIKPITANFPSSPAKKGEFKRLPEMGGGILQELQKGMVAGIPDLERNLAGLTAGLATPPAPAAAGPTTTFDQRRSVNLELHLSGITGDADEITAAIFERINDELVV